MTKKQQLIYGLVGFVIVLLTLGITKVLPFYATLIGLGTFILGLVIGYFLPDPKYIVLEDDFKLPIMESLPKETNVTEEVDTKTEVKPVAKKTTKSKAKKKSTTKTETKN